MGERLKPVERRMKILSLICKVRKVTVGELEREFNVSNKTIRNDIKYLSIDYPIETNRGRYEGGIKILNNYYMCKKHLSTEQIDVLEKIKKYLPSKYAIVIESILNEFALCREVQKMGGDVL